MGQYGLKQDPIRSNIGRNACYKKSIKTKKIISKNTILLANFKGNNPKIISILTLLSTITLKLIYVYHYMTKKKCLAIYRK